MVQISSVSSPGCPNILEFTWDSDMNTPSRTSRDGLDLLTAG